MRHDALITAAVTEHGGIVLKHKGEGDSTFSIFDSAPAAVAAATQAQRQLDAESWPDVTPIVVRMGIHTGEAVQRGRDYYGQTVNRAARVRALAVGGQVLLTSASAALVGGSLPEGTELRFLRSELLRGTDKPEAIHELIDHRRALPATAASAAFVAPPSLPAPLAVALPPVFVGRRDLTELIHEVRHRASKGGGVETVLLGGEPGAGKTSVAAAVARVAHAQDWTVLFGACDEHVSTPYEPFREAVTQYVGGAPTSVLIEHIASQGGEIARLAPNLAARVGALPLTEAVDPETSRRLLFEAITDLMSRASRDQPVLFVLDDFQWADRNTMLLMLRLASLRDSGPLVLLGTYRSTDADVPAVRDVLAQLRALPSVTDLSVEGLSSDALSTLLEAAAGHELGEEGRAVAAYLEEETDGNPLFAVELVRHLVETGVLAPDTEGRWHTQVDLTSVEVPRTVRAVLHTRVGRLDPEAQRVLGMASVAGREFDSAVVASALELHESAVLDHLEAAARASLVRERSVGHFEFSHALVQHTLYDDLSATRRSLHHRQLALTLESGEAAAAPAVVATHWEATGREPQKVADWAGRAGDDAFAALSPEDAIRWYRTALDALESIDAPDASRLGLLISLGSAQRWADTDAFRQTLLDAAGLAERLGDDDGLVRAALANNRGGASRAGAVDLERVGVLERAIGVAGTEDSPERARLLATLALELSQGGEWERRIALADEAVACARRMGDEVTLLRVLLHTTEATRLPTTLDQRLIDTEELFDIAKRLGDPVLLGVAAVRNVRVKIEAAAFDQVDEALDVLEQVAHLDPYVRLNRPSLLAVLAHVRGDLPAALAFAEEARVVGGAEPDALAVYAATTAQILWDMGSLGVMVPTVEQTVREHPGVTGFRGILGAGLVEVGRVDEARAILRHEVETAFADHVLNPVWLITISVFASLAIELEDREAARMLYGILDPWRGRANSSVVSINGLVTESLAGLAVVAGDFAAAERDVAEALEQANRVGARVSATRTRLTRARLLAARGDANSLQTALAEARAVAVAAREIGMGAVERRATDLAASLATSTSTVT